MWGREHAEGEHFFFTDDVDHGCAIDDHEGSTARVHEEAAAGLGIATEDNKTAHAARKDLDRVPFRDEDAEESSIFIGVLREEEASPDPDDREFELAIREETHLAARKDCLLRWACRAEVGIRVTLRSFGAAGWIAGRKGDVRLAAG